jgi:hypothetical protein
MLLFLVPAVRLYIPAAPALSLAAPRLAPPAMQLRDGNTDSSVIVSGGSRQTWFYDSNVQQVQVVLNSDGRPLDADVEVWQDEFGNNVPWKMHAYIESADVSLQNGELRPFSAVVETPRGPNTVAVRNTGQPMNSLSASVGAGPVRCPSAECLSSCTSIVRGSSRTYQFDPSVGSIQILLETTDNRPLNARIELLESPNNNKQVVEVYSQDGCDRPFFCILETPRAGSTVSVISTANDDMTAAVVPQDINQGMTSNAQRLRRGRQQGGYGPAFGQGGDALRDATQRNRNRRQQGYGPTYGQGQQGDYLEQDDFLQQFLFQGDRNRGYGPAFGQGQGGYGQQGYYNRARDDNVVKGTLKNLFRKSEDGYGPRGDYRQQSGFQNIRDRVPREQGGYGQYGPQGGFQNTRDATQRNRNRRQRDNFGQRGDYSQQSGLQRFFQRSPGRQGGFGQQIDYRQQSGFQSTRDQIRSQQRQQSSSYGPALGQGQQGGGAYRGQQRDYKQQSGFQSTRDQIRGQQRQQAAGYGPALGQGQNGGYRQKDAYRQQGGRQGQQGYMQRGDFRQQGGFQGNRRQQGQQGGDEYAPFSAMSDNFNNLAQRFSPGGRLGRSRLNLGRQSSRATGARRSWGGDD